jgi:hypothetical protein
MTSSISSAWKYNLLVRGVFLPFGLVPDPQIITTALKGDGKPVDPSPKRDKPNGPPQNYDSETGKYADKREWMFW